MAIYYYNERQLEKAIEFFEKAAEISKKTMGLDSDNYKNILSNIEFIKEELGKISDTSSSQKNKVDNNKIGENLIKGRLKNIKGLELSKKIFLWSSSTWIWKKSK